MPFRIHLTSSSSFVDLTLKWVASFPGDLEVVMAKYDEQRGDYETEMEANRARQHADFQMKLQARRSRKRRMMAQEQELDVSIFTSY